MILVTSYVDVMKSPSLVAGFHLLYSVANKAYYTNLGINFYLYDFSGQKFRKDLIQLFRFCSCVKHNMSNIEAAPTSMATITSTISATV